MVRTGSRIIADDELFIHRKKNTRWQFFQGIHPVFISLFMLSTIFAAEAQSIVFRGTVMGDTSEAGVCIIELYSPSQSVALYTITTDQNGLYYLDNIADQEYRIKISSPKYQPQWFSTQGNTLYPQYKVWVGKINEIKLVTHPLDNYAVSILKVVVLDTNKIPVKIPNAVNLIQGWDDTWLMGEQIDTNIVVFSNLHQENYALFISSPPYPPQYYGPTGNAIDKIYFPISGKDTTTILMKLTVKPLGNGIIAGRCMTENGSPASGFLISLFKVVDTLNPVYSVTTLSDGRFGFNQIMENNYYLKIKGEGYPVQWYSRSRALTVTFPDDAIGTFYSYNSDSIFIAVSPTPVENTPRSKITVKIFDSTGAIVNSSGYLQLIESANQMRRSLDFDPTLVQYSAENLFAGNYSLYINISGYEPQFYSPSGNSVNNNYQFTLGSKDTMRIVTYLVGSRKDPGSTTQTIVKGAVTDSGRIAIGVTVKLFDKNNILQNETITDANGMYQMQVSAGVAYYLAVESSQYPVQYWSRNGSTFQIYTENLFSVPGGTAFVADVTISRNATVNNTTVTNISGTVFVKTNANPVLQVSVLLFKKNRITTGLDFRNIQADYAVKTDNAGVFKFQGIPFDTYMLLVNPDTINLIPQFYPGVFTIADAKFLSISQASPSLNIRMDLSEGAVLKGKILSEMGQAISGINISTWHKQSQMSYNSKTDESGVFRFSGLQTGTYIIGIGPEDYIPKERIKFEYEVKEGTVTEIEPIVMIRGGYISGKVVFTDTGENIKSKINDGQIYLFADSAASEITWPIQSVYTFIRSGTSNGLTAEDFITQSCKPGNFKMILAPNPIPGTDAILDTLNYQTNFGWSLVTSDLLQNSFKSVRVNPIDTAKNLLVKIRKGYSVFGTITFNGMARASINYSVAAFAKIDSTYYMVSVGRRINGSRFELPGLVPDEEYFIQVWADGFLNQYWSKAGNSLYPKNPYKIDLSSPLIINVVDTLKPEERQELASPVHLHIPERTATLRPILKWEYDKSLNIDTFKIYKSDRFNECVLLSRIPVQSAKYTYEYVDEQTRSDVKSQYIVVGKGKNSTVRSNSCIFEPRVFSVTPNQIWLDVYVKNKAIIIEWGTDVSTIVKQTDSIAVFRKKGKENWIQYTRKSGFEREIWDSEWNYTDSGKIFQYKIEFLSRSLVSDIKSITIDTSLISIRAEIAVGPYEKYKTIQQAIDAAVEFDHIKVRAGTYKENINLKGKIIMISGEWEFGQPPVIDGSGGVAVTVPYLPVSDGRCPNIEGFKITNASNGILAKSAVSIKRCLFTNVAKAVESYLDSSSVSKALIDNPFLKTRSPVYVSRCTFIASNAGNYIASAAMAGVQENNTSTGTNYYDSWFYLNPLPSWGTSLDIQFSTFAFYYTRANQSTLPLKVSGNSAWISLRQCNVWQTLSAAPMNVRVDDELYKIDPQFIDTSLYFTPQNSPLKLSGIGYDSDWKDNTNEDEKEPGVIRNLQVTILGLSRIGLQWDPSPDSEKVISYRIYRGPGDASLFYVNKYSSWDLNIPEDSVFKVLDSFSTKNSYFVDTAVVPGKPYLYVVVAIDSAGHEGKVLLSSPPHISQYFVNTYQFDYRVNGGVWYMLSPWGTKELATGNNQNISLYWWNDKGESSKLFSQYITVTELKPGNGYWFKSQSDTLLKIGGVMYDSLTNVKNVKLWKGASGWNQISSPYPFAVSPSWLNKIAAWEWNPDSLGYERAYKLKPWNAYWVNVSADTALPYMDNTSWPQRTTMAKQMQSSIWELTLSLKGKSVWDLENKIGVVKGTLNKNSCLNVQEPPEAFGGSQLFFVQPDDNGVIQKLSYQYKMLNIENKNKYEWQVCITPSENAATIHVQNVKSLPEGVFVYWVQASGVQNLGVSDQIYIPPHSDNAYGYIVATSNVNQIALYKNSLTLHAPYPNPFRSSAAFQITVPYSWLSDGTRSIGDYRTIELVIFDLGGRMVKTLLNGKIMVGTHNIIWNGENEKSGQVPAGLYLARLRCDSYVKSERLCRMR